MASSQTNLVANWESSKRSPPFSDVEIDRLMRCVEKHKRIVECKKTDHMNNRLKKDIWKTMENEFNMCAEGSYRDAAVLKRKYDNLKKRRKEKFANEQMSQNSLNPDEIMRLLSLVDLYAITSLEDEEEKTQMWEMLAHEFNEGSNGSYKNALTLKAEYNLLKKKTTSKLNKEKKERKKTGGGQEENTELSQVDNQIAGLLGNRLTGDNSRYDSDVLSSYMIEEEDEEIEEGQYTFSDDNSLQKTDFTSKNQDIEEIFVNSPNTSQNRDIEEPSMSIQNRATSIISTCNEKNNFKTPAVKRTTTGHNWGGNTTPLLKEPKSSCLDNAAEPDESTKRKRNANTKISEWAMSKIALNKLQEKDFNDETARKKKRETDLHEEKMKNMKELHAEKLRREKRIALLEVKEIKNRIMFMEAKHKLELEVLRIQKAKLLGTSTSEDNN